MIAIPAVDLREGACVQLVGGDLAQERIRLDDPVEVARGWEREGFSMLHVVDLDAALGRGDNARVVRELIRNGDLPIQLGGGIRSSDQVEEWLEEGVTRIVVGTRALEDPDWLAEIATAHPGSIVLAADVRERRVVTRGWVHTLPVDILDLVRDLEGLPLAAILVTAVHMEGKMEGTDLTLIEDVCDASPVPVIASGGIGGVQDLRALEHRGASAAVIGMALYTGAIDARAVAQEFSE
ncbi:MAG: 1-(5-phosphoribosyl)-5-(5-phosphoribosylamino)methylideneamino imidazole-4-carboxamide isomerase [Gemmatimonadetes bacterium]|nr:1-(5-phosphoribosyl)-5-(5-phosphoribosylamino)methylideneamino imidazole-4-carboxamide isomerase [Gemmatimonadota bacterium]